MLASFPKISLSALYSQLLSSYSVTPFITGTPHHFSLNPRHDFHFSHNAENYTHTKYFFFFLPLTGKSYRYLLNVFSAIKSVYII